jgi:hypothetical protein
MTDTIDYAARWADLQEPVLGDVAAYERNVELLTRLSTPAPERRLYKPLADAADEYVRWCQSPHERIYTGMAELDAEMRGTAPGEMTMFLGYSHSGKTLVLTKSLIHNRDKRILFFQPDEPRVLTLIKLVCAYHGLAAVDFEQRIAADDEEAKALLRSTATEVFPYMAVVDNPLSTQNMERAWDEATDEWGASPELVVVDFLELMEDLEMVPQKATWLKGFGRRHDVPMYVLHQLSRSSGADGKQVTISSGAYGGETQATHLIGVRRKRSEIQARINELRTMKSTEARDDEIASLEYDLKIHQFTVSVNLVKNKRPGGDLLPEIDFELIKASGQLLPLGTDLPRQYRQQSGLGGRAVVTHDRRYEQQEAF